MSSFWTITTYYNPENYQNRLHNFHRFRTHLNSKLLVVEHSVDGRFALTPNDADILIQLTGGDVLWHKERLLNIALKNLPENVEFVAWVDCDIVFEKNDWQADAARLLGRNLIIQLFSALVDLPPDFNVAGIRAYQTVSSPGIVEIINSGLPASSAFSLMRSHGARIGNPGTAWAATRDFLERHQFYDRTILGGGDTAFGSALFGDYKNFLKSRPGLSKFETDYHDWAQAVFEDVSGRVGRLNGCVYHLWHGEMINRRYRDRYNLLVEYDFSPLEDLEEVESGVWRLKDHKRDLAEAISDYFKGRREDG